MPRPVKRTDDGFEDREDHQAPITLRAIESGTGGTQRAPPATDRAEQWEPRSSTRSTLGAHLFEDRVRLRELPGLQLGMDFFAIDADLKRAAARGHEGQPANVLLEPQQFFRQTDGMRLVVSSGAILDRYIQRHGSELSPVQTTAACQPRQATRLLELIS